MSQAANAMRSNKHGELNMSMAELTFPAFITVSMSVAYGIIDSWFLSKISDSAAASVGGVFSFLAMSAFFLRAFAQAGGIIMGQYIGAQKQSKVSQSFGVSLLLNGGLGMLIALFIYASHQHIGRWLGFEEQLQIYSAEYLNIAGLLIFGQAFTVCYLVAMAIHGKTLWNMSVIALLNLVNIGGNYALIAFDDGRYFSVTSVAIASVFAQVVTCVVSAYLVHVKLGVRLRLKIRRETFRRISRSILKIAVPSALFPVSLQLNLLALVVIISSLGAEILATQVYTINIIMLIVAWTSSVAQSAQIYISRLIGAGNYAGAEQSYKRCIIWGVTGVLISVSIFYSLGADIFSMLTENSNIISLGVVILMLCFILEPFRAVNLITLAALNSAGDAKFPGLLSILMMWLIGFSLSWWFGIPLGYGLVGIYVGRIIDEIIRAAMVYWRWRSGVWKTLVPLEGK